MSKKVLMSLILPALFVVYSCQPSNPGQPGNPNNNNDNKKGSSYRGEIIAPNMINILNTDLDLTYVYPDDIPSPPKKEHHFDIKVDGKSIDFWDNDSSSSSFYLVEVSIPTNSNFYNIMEETFDGISGSTIPFIMLKHLGNSGDTASVTLTLYQITNNGNTYQATQMSSPTTITLTANIDPLGIIFGTSLKTNSPNSIDISIAATKAGTPINLKVNDPNPGTSLLYSSSITAMPLRDRNGMLNLVPEHNNSFDITYKQVGDGVVATITEDTHFPPKPGSYIFLGYIQILNDPNEPGAGYSNHYIIEKFTVV